MTSLAPAYVSTCNSKRVIPPLSVTDRDVIGRPLAMSRSVTIRRVFSPLVLRIETNLKLGWRQTRRLIDKKETGPVPQGTEPETLMEPVTGIEPATH